MSPSTPSPGSGLGKTLELAVDVKFIKKCCKRFERKNKACKDCPVVAALGCERTSKKVKKALKKTRIAA